MRYRFGLGRDERDEQLFLLLLLLHFVQQESMQCATCRSRLTHVIDPFDDSMTVLETTSLSGRSD
jgi:hypothetical protein